MDPLMGLIRRWKKERDVFRRSDSRDLIELSRTHSRELRTVLGEISEAHVPYELAPEMTGYALGSLKNTLNNVGTRGEPAFRLGDLPFKAGRASPAKILMAARILEARMGD